MVLKVRWIRRATGASSAGGRREIPLDARRRHERVPFPSPPCHPLTLFAPRPHPWNVVREPNSNASGSGRPSVPLIAAGWRRCCERLRARMGEDVFNSSFAAWNWNRWGQARLSVPTRFLKSWIDTHYVGHVTTALTAAGYGPIARILVSVRSSSRRQDVDQPDPPALRVLQGAGGGFKGRGSLRSRRSSGDRASARLAFVGRTAGRLAAGPTADVSTFELGRSNRLAFSAAHSLAERARGGGSAAFCPLYVHSAVGSARSCHLLQAVARAHTAASQGRSAIYLTAEKFMYGFVAALQAQTSIAFKERLPGDHLR